MCGIFGAIRTGNGRITTSVIKEMAKEQEKRGPHAFGVTWLDSRGRIHSFKSEGKISEALILFDRMKEAQAIVGHTRFSTHGEPSQNTNNHPHPCDGGWYVHNGQILEYREIIEDHDLLPLTECDSEVLGLLVQSFEGSLLRRVGRAINNIDQTRPLTMAGIWPRPGRVMIAKRGNPLSISCGTTGNTYFASKKVGLPGIPRRVEEDKVFVVDLAKSTWSEKDLFPFEDTGVIYAGSGSGTWGRTEWDKGRVLSVNGIGDPEDDPAWWEDDVDDLYRDTLDEDELEILKENEQLAELPRQYAIQEKLGTNRAAALRSVEAVTGERIEVPNLALDSTTATSTTAIVKAEPTTKGGVAPRKLIALQPGTPAYRKHIRAMMERDEARAKAVAENKKPHRKKATKKIIRKEAGVVDIETTPPKSRKELKAEKRRNKREKKQENNSTKRMKEGRPRVGGGVKR